MKGSDYLAVLRRYWWLVAAGVVAGAIAATLVTYSVSGFPPSFEHRKHPTYTASSLILVNSAANPYLRTNVANIVTRAAKTRAADQGASASDSTGTQALESMSLRPPDTHVLVQAANLFPLLIASDQVARVRVRLFGRHKGAVQAKALYSFVTPSRFKQSAFPIIQVSGIGKTPRAAIRMAQDTTVAFKHWLVASQQAGGVPAGQRILVEEILTPKKATASGRPTLSLPLAIGVAVLAAFVGLALLLGNRDPAREVADDSTESLDHEPEVAAVA